MCLKRGMNGLPQGSVVSSGQWAESEHGESGCAQALRAEPLTQGNCGLPACVLGLFTVSMLTCG